jgi:hypothetical protein
LASKHVDGSVRFPFSELRKQRGGSITNHRHFEALRMPLTHAVCQKPTTLPQIILHRGALAGPKHFASLITVNLLYIIASVESTFTFSHRLSVNLTSNPPIVTNPNPIITH